MGWLRSEIYRKFIRLHRGYTNQTRRILKIFELMDSPTEVQRQMHLFYKNSELREKELRALRGSFVPPRRPKNEIRFSSNSYYWFIRTMNQVYKSDISLTFTFAMVTKMAIKTS